MMSARRGIATGGILAVLGVVLSSGEASADTKGECIAAADRGQERRDQGDTGGAREAFAECARDVCPAIIAQSCRKWGVELEAAKPASVVAPEPRTSAPAAGAGGPSPSPPPVPPPPETPATSAPPAAPSPPFLRSARGVTTLSLLGGAALATAGAIAFGAASRDEAGVAASYRATNPSDACVRGGSAMCVAWSDAVDAQNRDAIVNRVLYVTAGTMLVASALTWLWPHAGEPGRRAAIDTKGERAGVLPARAPIGTPAFSPFESISPMVGPGEAGIVLRGTL